jgi:hypothetical protein
MKKNVTFMSALISLALNAGLTILIAYIWFYPLLMGLNSSSAETLSWPSLLVAVAPIIIIIGLSIIIGGLLRWSFGRTDSAVAMISAALFGPLVAGWAAAASGDLRASLMGLRGDGGLISLAYFGAWLVTFTYLMKLPWDRATEIIRDRLKAKFEPEKPTDKCSCRKPNTPAVPSADPPLGA